MNNRFEIFTMLISKANKNMRKIKNKKMEQYGMKSIHVSIIYLIYINKTLTATELCEKCEEDKGTISRALEFLENNQYIICDSKQSKRYNSPFKLTVKGNEIGQNIFEMIDDVLSELDDCLSEEERIQFYNSFTKINDKIEIICKEILKEEK